MSLRIISCVVLAMLGFAALPAEAHIAVAYVTPAQIEAGRTGYITQNLENILPDVFNVEPQAYLAVRYDCGAAKDDSDGVSL